MKDNWTLDIDHLFGEEKQMIESDILPSRLKEGAFNYYELYEKLNGALGTMGIGLGRLGSLEELEKPGQKFNYDLLEKNVNETKEIRENMILWSIEGNIKNFILVFENFVVPQYNLERFFLSRKKSFLDFMKKQFREDNSMLFKHLKSFLGKSENENLFSFSKEKNLFDIINKNRNMRDFILLDIDYFLPQVENETVQMIREEILFAIKGK